MIFVKVSCSEVRYKSTAVFHFNRVHCTTFSFNLVWVDNYITRTHWAPRQSPTNLILLINLAR